MSNKMVVMHGTTQRAVHISGLDWQIEKLDANDDWQAIKVATVTQEQHDKMVAAHIATITRTSIKVGNI